LTPLGDETERVVPFGVERSLRSERLVDLSISDIDRVLEYLQRVRSVYAGRETISSMKLGEIGLSIPEDFVTARSLIEQLGGVDELNYFALMVPQQVLIEADFGKKSLRIRAPTDAEVHDLWVLWNHTGRTQSTEVGST